MFGWIVLAVVIAGGALFAIRRMNERRRRHAIRLERQGVRKQRLAEWEEDIRRRSGEG